MIYADDIKNLVLGGEGFNVEFKRSVPSKVREISEEVCAFTYYSVDFSGIGWAFCYWPGEANAVSITYNAADITALITTEGVPNASGAARLDYYFMIPQKEGDPSLEN